MEQLHTKVISRDNLTSLDLAFTRIGVLSPVINRKMLQNCLEGDEEALYSTRHFLMNSGWWEKAYRLNIHSLRSQTRLDHDHKTKEEENRLVDSIMQYEEFVHPNVIKMVKRKNNMGFKMTLN